MLQTNDDRRLDQYWTPAWVARIGMSLLESLGLIHVDHPERGTTSHISDPCMGRGDLLIPARLRGYTVSGTDIDLSHAPDDIFSEECDARSQKAHSFHVTSDAILTNPPYAADTGTAGDVLSSLLKLPVPIAALLNNRFTAEMAQDRRRILDGTDARPRAILNVGRLEFTGPDIYGEGTPMLNQWVVWDPHHEGGTSTGWLSLADRERAKGQLDLDFIETNEAI